MHLNLFILAHELGGGGWQTSIHSAPTERRFDHLAFPDADGQWSEEAVYLVEADKLRTAVLPHRNLSFICLGTPPKNLLERANVDIIWNDSTVAPEAAANSAIRVFMRYGQWEQALQRIALGIDPISEAGSVSYPFFDNPLFFMDLHYNVYFYEFTPSEDVPLERVASYLESEDWSNTASISSEHLVDLLSYEEFHRASLTHGPSIYHGGQDFTTLYFNIFSGNVNVARLGADAINHPFSDFDYAVIQILGEYLDRAVQAGNLPYYNLSAWQGEVLDMVIERKYVPPEKLASFCEHMGWQQDDPLFCMVADTEQHAPTIEVSASLTAQLALDIGCPCATVRDGRMVFIANLRQAELDRDGFLHGATATLRDSLLTVGASASFRGLAAIPGCYRQALVALEEGKEHDADRWIHRFEDVALRFVIDQSLKELPREALCPPGLLELVRSDQKSGHNDVELLRHYLDNGMNASKTTREMYLHRNTFAYRMKVITRILGVDLADADQRLVLELALRALEA